MPLIDRKHKDIHTLFHHTLLEAFMWCELHSVHDFFLDRQHDILHVQRHDYARELAGTALCDALLPDGLETSSRCRRTISTALYDDASRSVADSIPNSGHTNHRLKTCLIQMRFHLGPSRRGLPTTT